MPENKKFWKFCNQVGNTVELLLYGDISQTSWWGDEVTPRQFAEELAGLGALDKIVVRINSGGGDGVCRPGNRKSAGAAPGGGDGQDRRAVCQRRQPLWPVTAER